jgi:hypothetical protein
MNAHGRNCAPDIKSSSRRKKSTRLAVHGDAHTISARMRGLLYLDAHVYRRHDPIAELLGDERLDRLAVDQDGFVEAVDDGIRGGCG